MFVSVEQQNSLMEADQFDGRQNRQLLLCKINAFASGFFISLDKARICFPSERESFSCIALTAVRASATAAG